MHNKTIQRVMAGILMAAIVCAAVVLGAKHSGTVSDAGAEETAQTGKAEIVKKQDASYERWLAAAMMTAISMQEGDFEVQHIYFSSENKLGDKMKSDGVCMVYTSGEETRCIQCKPLEAERKEKGTTDLYTKDLGFCSFDQIDRAALDTQNLQEIDPDSLSELISQSMLVSLYEN